MLILAVAATTIVGIWSTVGEIRLLERLQNGEAVTIEEAMASDQRVAAVGRMALVILVLAIVVYLVWIHRAVANLDHVRSGQRSSQLRFSPGWAVGWYFVPIMNLVRPYQAMRELYTESNPEHRTSPLVGWWWASWLLGGFIGPSVSRLFSDPTIAEAIAADYQQIAADVTMLVAAGLIVAAIARITGWQRRRAGELGID